MIKLLVTSHGEGEYISYTLSGHAMYGEYGQDIVCAAVSVLALATLNYITEIFQLDGFVEYEIKDGYMKVELQDLGISKDQREIFHKLVAGLVINMESIASQYPDSLKLEFRRIE